MRWLWAFAVLVTCVVLLTAVRAETGQVVEWAEGETTVCSEDSEIITVAPLGRVSPEMVWIEPGTVGMGTPEGDLGGCGIRGSFCSDAVQWLGLAECLGGVQAVGAPGVGIPLLKTAIKSTGATAVPERTWGQVKHAGG